MNLLAHLHLSEGHSIPVAAGNVLADFVRRSGATPIDAAFLAGMKLHQAIDIFAESDGHHRAARACITGPRRRLAGIIVDVAYDYCLSRHWARFSHVPLQAYVSRRVDGICDYVRAAGSPLGGIAARARMEGWLLSYATIAGVRDTFRRMSGRSRAAAPLLGAEAEVERHLDFIETTFGAFYPRLMAAFPRGDKRHLG
jgi:acyl carrier protein phosphodiesterase